MPCSSAMEVNPSRPVLGGPRGIAVSQEWLRRGLASFLWASSRSSSCRMSSSVGLKEAPPKTGNLLTLMFVFYIIGLGLIVYAGT